uniref:Dual-specificity kinase n=1 Tax=Opuntia streptacantha TaxID=393608 RepID=A0A7C9D489_OPUST
MKENSDGYVRADQIDLKSLDEQLQRHLSRALTLERKRKEEEQEERERARPSWEIDPSKLLIKSVIARGTFGTVHRGVYDGLDVAGQTSRCFFFSQAFQQSLAGHFQKMLMS